MTTQSIYVIGGGALGIGLAGLLSDRTGVTLVVKDEQLEALRDQPIRVEGDVAVESDPGSIDLLGTSELSKAPPESIYFIAVKANALDEVLERLATIVTEESTIVLLQNGLDIFLQATQTIDTSVPVLRALVNFGLLKTSDATVRVSGLPDFTIACIQRDDARAARIVELFESLNAFVFKEIDIATAEWKKAVVNLIVNPVCTILDAPNGVLLEKAELQDLAADMLKEIQAVAAADGFDLSDIDIDSLLQKIGRHGSNINSSLSDRRSGRTSEMDFLLGRFLRRARSYDLDVPCMHTVHKLFMANEV